MLVLVALLLQLLVLVACVSDLLVALLASHTSLPSSAAPGLCPEQGGQHQGEEGEQAGDHVDHQRLLRQLGRVREGGGGGEGRPHRGAKTRGPVRVAHAVFW